MAPILYSKTKIMMVDDNLPFLENIQEKISNTFECMYSANPVEALDVIKKITVNIIL